MAHRKQNEPEKREAELNEESSLPETADETPTPATAAAPAEPFPPESAAKLQAERDELLQMLLRRQADFENYRKRVERESAEVGQRAVGRLVEELLPALDAFERAIAAHEDPAYEEYRKGFELIHRQLWDVLSRYGLSRIPAEGKRFDPNVHQAVERIESEEHEDGTVVAVLQDGYFLKGRVLRPAVVRVAVHPAESSAEAKHRIN